MGSFQSPYIIKNVFLEHLDHHIINLPSQLALVMQQMPFNSKPAVLVNGPIRHRFI